MVQLGPQGVLEGATTRGRWADHELSQCVSDAARSSGRVRFKAPSAVRETLDFRLDHQAEISFYKSETDDIPDMESALLALQDHNVRVDQCVLDTGERDPLDLRVQVKIGRRGDVRKSKVVNSTQNLDLDGCTTDVLSAESSIRLGGPVKGIIDIEYFEQADPDRVAAQVRARPPWTGEPSTLRVLGLVLERHDSPDGTARLRPDNRREVTEAHDDFAAFAATHTGGQVDVVSDVRVIDAEVHTVLLDEELTTPRWLPGEAMSVEDRAAKGMDEDEDEGVPNTALRFLVAPGDLSPELAAAVTPGAWDLVVLWVPMPWSEAAERVTHWEDDHLSGASFGALPLYPEGADLQALFKATLPLLAARAGTPFEVPDRLLPVWLEDGRYFDARPWSHYAYPLSWYAWVFAEALPPEFWAPATAHPVLLPAAPTNVAPLAEATTSRDVAGAQELNDTVLSVPWATVGARQDSVAARPYGGSWFGLEWSRMQRLDRVVAHLEGVDAASLEITTDGETWTTVAQIEPVESAVVEFVFPAAPVFALRVRVDVESPDVPIACTELEAHAVATAP